MTSESPRPVVEASAALERLREGNLRFVKNAQSDEVALDDAARRRLTGGQTPFAIILSCADSRVPAEIVFDQGLGDLFVVRVAGNVIAPSLVGSVEFAAAKFGTRLVVVMGHTQCGAIQATLDVVQKKEGIPSDNIRDIVERCKPAVKTVVDVGRNLDQDEIVDAAIRANVRNSCGHLRHGSPLLEQLIRDEGLRVVGAEYHLETGAVDFFDFG